MISNVLPLVRVDVTARPCLLERRNRPNANADVYDVDAGWRSLDLRRSLQIQSKLNGVSCTKCITFFFFFVSDFWQTADNMLWLRVLCMLLFHRHTVNEYPQGGGNESPSLRAACPMGIWVDPGVCSLAHHVQNQKAWRRPAACESK